MTLTKTARSQTATNGQAPTLIELRNVTKTYQAGNQTFKALDSIHLKLPEGEFTAIVGKSGSGKSTLLNLIAGIDRPTSGEIVVGGQAIYQMSENQMAIWRGRNVGVVFQFFQLLPTLTAVQNVMLAMDFCHIIPARERRSRALHLLEQVGVAELAHKRPAALSGGEQQRVAIARALANDPPIIVADEPTGNLDSHTTEVVFRLLQDLARQGKTVLMVTHERDITAWVTRTIRLNDGMILPESSARPEANHA